MRMGEVRARLAPKTVTEPAKSEGWGVSHLGLRGKNLPGPAGAKARRQVGVCPALKEVGGDKQSGRGAGAELRKVMGRKDAPGGRGPLSCAM